MGGKHIPFFSFLRNPRVKNLIFKATPMNMPLSGKITQLTDHRIGDRNNRQMESHLVVSVKMLNNA